MRPRILLVSHSSGVYGAEKSLLMLAKGLDKKSYDIVVSCPKKGPLWEELAKLNIERIFLRTIRPLVERFRYIEGPLRLPIQMLNVLRIISIIRKGGFDVIHCNSLACLDAALAAKILGLPVIIHCREFLKGDPNNSFIGWRNTYLLAEYISDKVICNSRAVQNIMIEAGCRSVKTVVIYNGFEEDNVDFTVDGSLFHREISTKTQPIIGCVSAIHPRKDHQTLLQAFSIVRQKIPNAQLLIYGNGKKRYVRKIKRLTLKLNIENNTQFCGEIEKASDVYNQFKLFVSPSYAEAFGRVYVEAALRGIPAIGTSHGGASEIIEDGVTGFIVPPKNPEQLARAMLRILQNDKLAVQMSFWAKQHIREKFPYKKLIADVQEVYEELLMQRV
jgi:glycosyltransferase involved in cell wall biosynthesis